MRPSKSLRAVASVVPLTSLTSLTSLTLLTSLLFGGALTSACTTPHVVAPRYASHGGAALTDQDFPLAAAELFFTDVHAKQNAGLAKLVTDRLLARAHVALERGQERTGLAAIRIGAMLMRVATLSPSALSDDAVAALQRGVEGPAARGDEGAALGLYGLWHDARPSEPRVGPHLGALEAWTLSPADRSSPLIMSGRIGLRAAEQLAYAPTAADRKSADQALYRWMTGVGAFKDGQVTQARYADEVYWALLGLKTSGVRLLAGHLRDGDLSGAVDALSVPATQGFLSEELRSSVIEAGSSPTASNLRSVILALDERAKEERLDEVVGDAVLGTALVGLASGAHDSTLTEGVARGLLRAGAGDAAPAIVARAILGTEDAPRVAKVAELGRGLRITGLVVTDALEREDFDGARRAFSSADPLLRAADATPGATPNPSDVRTLMGIVEAEAGRAEAARPLFDQAIAVTHGAGALLGRARLRRASGDLAGAQLDADLAARSPDLEGEPALFAEVSALLGDLARAHGDAAGAGAFYRKAVVATQKAKDASRGTAVGEAERRLARLVARFEDAATLQDAVTGDAERDAGNDAGLLGEIALRALQRPLRAVDPTKARAALRRCVDIGVRPDDQVRAAIVVRAVTLRSGVAIDDATTRVLTLASARDDFSGKLARYALGALGGDALLAAATSPRTRRAALFAIALDAWAKKNDAAAKAAFDAVTRASLTESIEADFASDLVDPTRATVAGAP